MTKLPTVINDSTKSQTQENLRNISSSVQPTRPKLIKPNQENETNNIHQIRLFDNIDMTSTGMSKQKEKLIL